VAYQYGPIEPGSVKQSDDHISVGADAVPARSFGATVSRQIESIGRPPGEISDLVEPMLVAATRSMHKDDRELP
jgi:hypothetical protein